jgi:hypothetical protein
MERSKIACGWCGIRFMPRNDRQSCCSMVCKLLRRKKYRPYAVLGVYEMLCNMLTDQNLHIKEGAKKGL